jgi:hypothetical protein
MATRMVDAVIPMSEAGTVPVGAAEADCEAAADVEATADDEVAGADALLVLEELHPAASRTAATAAAATAAKRVRLGVRRPVPPRPGDSLLGLIAALHDFLACEVLPGGAPAPLATGNDIPGGQ